MSTKHQYRATFTPQAWQNDYAISVDAEGETSWIISDEFLQSLPDPIKALKSHTYESDELRNDPAAPVWVREWSGPFEITVERVFTC